MYSEIVRSSEYIQQLLGFIRCEYGLDGASIVPAKRGFYGETWKLGTADSSYFIKTAYPSSHMRLYEGSFPVIEHLCRHGIDFISRIVKSLSGRLSTRFDGAVLGVFEWIDGENRQDEITKVQEYQMLAKVYKVPVIPDIAPREHFSTGSADAFFRLWASLPLDSPMRASIGQRRARIEHRAERLRIFAERCSGDASPLYITHGDAGGNFLVGDGKNYIVDWDTPILAPPERDAWFGIGWDWAIEAFRDALRQQGIDYTLRKERMAYYSYNMYFYYLNAFMEKYILTGATQGFEEFMDDWIEESFQYADRIN
ncbi:MAG: aminoglycoside phosphotransferase family protein [Lachnospiraceae bacterium]|nr:aminoglycoside phosphotransferase family protein [Lachnospiraceae bacterium]